MKYKRLMYAVVAFLMVGANFGGAVRVFADEINTDEVVEGASSEVVSVESGAEASVEAEEETTEPVVTTGTTTTTTVVEADDEAEPVEDEDAIIAEEGAAVQTRAAALPATTELAPNDEPVLRAAPMPESNTRFLAEVGDTVELNIDGLSGQPICFVMKNYQMTQDATCNPTAGTVTVNETGIYTVMYTWRLTQWPYSQQMFTGTILAYDVTADPESDALSTEDMDGVVDFVAEQIQELLVAGQTYNNYLYLEGSWGDIWSQLVEDPHFVVKVEIGEDKYNEARDEVAAEIKDTETEAATYGGYIFVYIGEDEVGEIFELKTPVFMQLEIPADSLEAPEGYTRTFYVIRGHEAVDMTNTATRITPTQDGNMLGFMNNLFSTFKIVYEDVEDEVEEETEEVAEAPNTGAMLESAGSATSGYDVAVIFGTVVMLAGVVKFATRK